MRHIDKSLFLIGGALRLVNVVYKLIMQWAKSKRMKEAIA